MDLEDLRRRLEYEQGEERDREPIKIMDSDGALFEVLSVNWDDNHDCWVIVGEYDA